MADDKVVEVRAELTANVWKVEVRVGDAVELGDVLTILESMKMEIPVEATISGTVRSIAVEAGGRVLEGDLVATLEETP